MERCEKCGSQKILQNEVPTCIFCFGKEQVVPKRAPVMIEDPGEAAMEDIVGMKKQPVKAVAPAPKVAAAGTAEDALRIMKTLPIPDDIKSFKKIKRIIKHLEELIQNDN